METMVAEATETKRVSWEDMVVVPEAASVASAAVGALPLPVIREETRPLPQVHGEVANPVSN